MELKDVHGRCLCLTESNWNISEHHPPLADLLEFLGPAVRTPSQIAQLRTDGTVELFYRHFETTPVTNKSLCVVVPAAVGDLFIITAHFTNSIKNGEVLWTGT